VSQGTELGAQYFARYAEPEARLAAQMSDAYSACLVVPVCGEAPSLLDGFLPALERAPGRVLLVLVVNATESANAETHASNRRLLAALAVRFPEQRLVAEVGVRTQAVLGRAASCDLLWLDRAKPGVYLPEREGVGSARKIGGDFAAALWAQGQIACPLIASSDADVSLPSDYFATLASAPPEAGRSAAWLWPFQHEAGGDARIDDATVLYEISLRYYVLGLAMARSSYAYQSIGSTLCVDARAYLSVRGFPKRAAGEDFYMLDKLAKVGPLRRITASPVRIRARASDRVPFGTGRRTQEIAEESAAGSEFLLYSPQAFRALSAVLAGLDEFAASAEPGALPRVLEERAPELAAAARRVLDRLGAFAALDSAATQAPLGPVLRRRVHTWFDALRTLRFIHGMRELGLSSLPWRDALGSADFVPSSFRAGDSPGAVCHVLSKAEAALPAQVGPALL
jgi:hypothetical protein